MIDSTVHHGDCLEVLRTLADCSVDAVVTDPPYGLSFMGRKWDYDVPSVDVWAECLRVLKPGGHLLAFAGTRTQHRMCCRIEDAGFEIRDMIAWVYGSGFPKSLDVSKAIDKAAGAEGGKGAVTGSIGSKRNSMAGDFAGGEYHEYLPATDAARQWQGWGTALKPALEPITVARKPLVGTVAANVLAHGTGAINIGGCRVGDEVLPAHVRGLTRMGTFEGAEGNWTPERNGRWPANLIHDGSDEVIGLFPWQESGSRQQGVRKGMGFHGADGDGGPAIEASAGSAARFFYCAKASGRDRGDANTHPTVKPTDLMRYLCRLVTPPGGVVLDPFMGSGSTGKAAALEGFRFIGIEREAEYVEIAKARINASSESLLCGSGT